MKRRRHTPEQIIRKLAEGEKLLGKGKPIEEVARSRRWPLGAHLRSRSFPQCESAGCR
jgi:hypothetical protein